VFSDELFVSLLLLLSGAVLVSNSGLLTACLLSVSSYFAQMDPMQWTDEMDECLAAVGTSKKCPNDEVFAFQVRLQLVAQRADQVRAQAGLCRETPSLPAGLYHKVLQGRLDEIRRSMPPGLQGHGMSYRFLPQSRSSAPGTGKSKQAKVS
jgi:hypothetical protein